MRYTKIIKEYYILILDLIKILIFDIIEHVQIIIYNKEHIFRLKINKLPLIVKIQSV